MKYFVFVSLILSSTYSFACPDLSGQYLCENINGETYELTVSQRIEDGFAIYNMNGNEFRADNEWRTKRTDIPDGVNEYNLETYRSSCIDDAFDYVSKMEYYTGGYLFVTSEYRASHTRSDTGFRFQGTYVLTDRRMGGGSQSTEFDETCTELGNR